MIAISGGVVMEKQLLEALRQKANLLGHSMRTDVFVPNGDCFYLDENGQNIKISHTAERTKLDENVVAIKELLDAYGYAIGVTFSSSGSCNNYVIHFEKNGR